MAIASTFKEQVSADKLRRFANSVAVLNPQLKLTTPRTIDNTMPSAYRSQSLTPPDCFPVYAGNGVQLNPIQFAVGHPAALQEKGGSKGMYAGHEFLQSSTFAGPTVQMYHTPQDAHFCPPGLMHPGCLYSNPASSSNQQSATSVERPCLAEDGPQRRPHQLQLKVQEAGPRVDDKPVGGVSAHLEYEMDEMADFVATVAHNIVQPNAQLPSQFRKFVYQILSSTRLPSSTIFLGMEYLSNRMNMLPGTHRSPGHVYRMLTIALLLASKFLDDNTFQNKSWAEVTGLDVAELNSLEAEWLVDIAWHLHVDPTGTKGFERWKKTWEQWRGSSNTNISKPNDRSLAPLNTNVLQHRAAHATFSQTMYSPHGLMNDRNTHIPSTRQHHPQADSASAYWWPSSVENSPPSAPETGPATPDYTFGSWGAPFFPPSLPTPTHHSQQNSAYPVRIPSISLPSLGVYQTHHHSVWPGGSTCGCGHCCRGDYFMSNFGQTVVG